MQSFLSTPRIPTANFYECPNSRELWNNIEKLLKERVSLKTKFSCFTIIFGYVNKDQNHIPINSLILVTKKYILDTSKDGKRLILEPIKHRLTSLLRDEEYCAKLNEKNRVFFHVWDRWASVFRSLY